MPGKRKTQTQKLAEKATTQKQRDAQSKRISSAKGRGGLFGTTAAAARARKAEFDKI